MRRPGHTLIEVLAALVVVAVVMSIGIYLGKRFVTTHNEQAYLQRVQSEWRSLQTQAEVEPQKIIMNFKAEERCITLASGFTVVQTLDLPKGLLLTSSSQIEQAKGKKFASPRVIYIHSRLGYAYRLAFEMGWGKLIVTKVVLAD